MNFWWVNQNQTFPQESEGGYLWSPKRKSNDQRNPFYEFMRQVAPGDVIFSFADTLIPAISIAQSSAYEFPKPTEFGTAGMNWGGTGWKISANYCFLNTQFRPADHIDRLWPLMPSKYAPLQRTGRGNQGVYLTWLPTELAEEIVFLIGDEARKILSANRIADAPLDLPSDPLLDVLQWEDYLVDQLQANDSLSVTERKAVIAARRGQGIFKRNVQLIEKGCRITGVSRPDHLIASHTKPWRDCDSSAERLDGENGLLLTPSIDHLFDRGLISFENTGELLVSPVAHRESLYKMGIPDERRINVGTFTTGQRNYLEYHRERVFLEANR